MKDVVEFNKSCGNNKIFCSIRLTDGNIVKGVFAIEYCHKLIILYGKTQMLVHYFMIDDINSITVLNKFNVDKRVSRIFENINRYYNKKMLMTYYEDREITISCEIKREYHNYFMKYIDNGKEIEKEFSQSQVKSIEYI